jgi:hypothetical protein
MSPGEVIESISEYKSNSCGCDDCSECTAFNMAMNFIDEWRSLWPPSDGKRALH